MADASYPNRRKFEQMARDDLRAHQLDQLNGLLGEILPGNLFYAQKLAAISTPLTSLDELPQLPFTTKDELAAAAAGELPPNTTYPPGEYVRFHRTSGTRGRPLVILDTAHDWQNWIEIWQYVLDSAGVTDADRACMAFSFGPFVGFWSAYDALAHRGTMVIPAGGMSTKSRLELITDTQATVVCCTPTYALRMQLVAQEHEIDLAATAVRAVIVAGEPGGSLPNVRDRIQSAWGATVYDHSGATEIGPWGYADSVRTGLHVAESHFIAEFLPSGSHATLEVDELENQDQPLELVLTALQRTGMPVIRYRTGDLVLPSYESESPGRFVLLQGGVLGRADDMVVIRGVNVFPSSIEEILRAFPDVDEFRVTARRHGEMDELSVEIEGLAEDACQSIGDHFQSRLGLRVAITGVSPGTLPRFEAKSKRFVDLR